MMSNPVVPARVGGGMKVESGLNDGIATPLVMVASPGPLPRRGSPRGRGRRVLELVVGVAVGGAVGAPAAGCSAGPSGRVGRPRSSPASPCWPSPCRLPGRGPDGNGFVAAFVGGLAFGAAAGPAERKLIFLEQRRLVSLLVWLVRRDRAARSLPTSCLTVALYAVRA